MIHPAKATKPACAVDKTPPAVIGGAREEDRNCLWCVDGCRSDDVVPAASEPLLHEAMKSALFPSGRLINLSWTPTIEVSPIDLSKVAG